MTCSDECVKTSAEYCVGIPSISDIAVILMTEWILAIITLGSLNLIILLNGIGDLYKASAGTPVLSNVTTETPYSFSSSRRAQAVPSTEFFEAVYASKPSPLLPDPKKIKRPLLTKW